jgi:hypothetical protein
VMDRRVLAQSCLSALLLLSKLLELGGLRKAK